MKITTQETIKKFKQKHGNIYDYSKVEYKTAKTKVTITCKEHGDFEMTPNNHLCGNGCPYCAGRFRSREEKFQHVKTKFHSNIDYSLVTIDNFDLSPIEIGCPVHGVVSVNPSAHFGNRSGCPLCGKEIAANKTKMTIDEFVSKSNKVHDYKYDYRDVVLLGAHKKVRINCKVHGPFYVTPANHWSNKVGCPSCSKKNKSRGELKIAKFLDSINVSYHEQKKFKPLGQLKFDFFIPSLNLLIEFDGKQHYFPISWTKKKSPEEQFSLIVSRDAIKTKFAIDNNIRLERIRYDENLEQRLNEIFECHDNLLI